LQDGQPVAAGAIIIRQRGSKYLAGTNVARGGDDTLYAKKKGVIKFLQKTKTRFDGSRRHATIVAVV
jgi:large subunit ribosomal protein L27